jgi:hypothetical protein
MGFKENAKTVEAWQYFSHIPLSFAAEGSLRPFRLHDLRREGGLLAILPDDGGGSEPF